MNWSATPFESLYNSIEGGNLDIQIFNSLLPDLKNLNLNNDKLKNASSRSKLEKDEVTLLDGNTYKLGQNFIYATIQLSDELNLDELICCQLIVSSLPDLEAINNMSDNVLSLVRNGKVQYFIRRQYILQIVTYIINCVDENNKIYKSLVTDGTLTSNILVAFTSIHTQLSDIKKLINKAQILDTYDVLFQQNVKFKRDFLLKEYDTLGQLLYGSVDKGNLSKKDDILKILNHIVELDSNDFFLVYYLPAIFHSFRNLNRIPENDVLALHKHFLTELKNDSIYTKPIKVTTIFVFLAFFISWCKEKPESRAAMIDFKTDIDVPMTIAIELGAIEQLLIFSADTSLIEKDKGMELYYNIRSLLERHLPRLLPKQLIDNEGTYSDIVKMNNSINNSMMIPNLNQNESKITKSGEVNVRNKYQFYSVELSQTNNDIFLSTFHSVLQTIIGDCAFLLTKIKDAEEDSLLSGEDLNLDDICVKADLERFFLTIHYFYAARPEYSEEFWEDKESNAYGFIEWSAKCNDSLMRSCFYLMISSLSFGSKNVLNVFHYFGENSIVSWTIIAQCIKDYIIKISNLGNKIQERQQLQESTEVNTTEIALEEGLNEETIIFISSLFTLIGSVASNVDEDVKNTLSTLFTDVLFEFSKLETPLVGACFKTLSHLVPTLPSARSKFWFSLDTMVFKTYSLTNSNKSYRSAFGSILTNFTEVLGFLHLFDKLLTIPCDDGRNKFLEFGKLQFPSKLGQSYRKVGIWPYFDYILNDIFIPSTQIDNGVNRRTIQIPILNIINTALCSFDYTVILNSIPAGADLDKLVISDNFASYVQESPSAAIFNYLFIDKIFKSVFSIITVGIDHLSIDLEGGKEQLFLIESAVSVVNSILEHQNTYIEEFIPMLKQSRKDIYFTPKDIGLHGLRTFYDALFFNLTVVAHLGLYIGVDSYKLASGSLSIFEKLTVVQNAGPPEYSISNKLLTILDSVDESSRIKDAFISQIESPIDSVNNLSLKLQILHFITTNLSYANKTPTVSHLLLGFQVSNIVSKGPKLSTFINSGVSLLDSILTFLVSSLDSLSRENIDFAPMKLAHLSIEILLKLCRNPLTSDIVFEHLSEMEFFESLMKLDPHVTKFTLWNGRIFDFRSTNNGRLFLHSKSMGALLSFLCYRTYLIQFLSLFIHRVSFTGTESQVFAYVSNLISNTIYSAKIFTFFDTLNYRDIPLEEPTTDLHLFSELKINLELITFKNDCEDEIFDFSSIEPLLRLFSKSSTLQQSGTLLSTQNKTEKQNTAIEDVEKDISLVKRNITNLLCNQISEEYQLSILHAWVQLVQIIVSDGKLNPISRSNFILEVFTTVIPKVNDYVEFDVAFSEELISLIVFLYEIYEKDRSSIDKHETLDFRLSDIFKVCIHGILSPLSSVSLRSDFYTLANQYLVRALKDKAIARDILQSLRINSEKFIEIVCNDAIYGQGISRITSILLLDSLIQMGSLNEENFILESITKSAQLHLIIRSLKNTDSLLESDPGRISIDDLLYELTAFKTTVFFLIRIAETRVGSQALVQNKLFQIVESCSFLKIDPDLGMNLVFDEVNTSNSNFAKINISLDNHLFLENDSNCISLFELIVPIFQLICCVLVSSGDQNKNVISNVRKLLITFRKLLIGIFKRDALTDMKEYPNTDFSSKSLESLVKLSVILCTLTGYQGEEDSS